MRVFLACRLAAADAAQLQGALETLKREVAAARFRWIAPANYHVTLRFFGTLTEEVVDDVCRLIEPVVAGVRLPIACRVAASLALPSWSRPAVLALELESAGMLEDLAAACDAVVAPRYGAADHPFRAHLTVARCRRPRRMMAVRMSTSHPWTPPGGNPPETALTASCSVAASTVAPVASNRTARGRGSKPGVKTR